MPALNDYDDEATIPMRPLGPAEPEEAPTTFDGPLEHSGTADALVGTTIGRCRFIRLIGSGAMGSGYAAGQD